MKRRALTAQLDQFKAERNDGAKADAALVKQHGNLPADVVEQRKQLGLRITQLESEQRNIESVLEAKALFVPNPPLPDLPDGDAAQNKVVRSWGTPRPQDPGLQPHGVLAERLGLCDPARGPKLPRSGFPLVVGPGARLVRGLCNVTR